ncbi:MAG TPA: hypothetical protein VGN00_20640 [Puia sp.]|jgi:hypothetical protein
MKPGSFPNCLLLYTLLLACPPVFAQSPAKGNPVVRTQPLITAEQELVKHLDKLSALNDQWGSNAPEDIEAYIETENDLLGEDLQKLTAANPSSLTYKFPRLVAAGMRIATSPDDLFRIYSWDQHAGGTAHEYNKVYQYKGGDKLYSKSEIDGDNGNRYSKIYQLDANNKRYYLGVGHVRVSTLREYESVQAFRIEEGVLIDTAHIIKTQSGLTGTLGFEYVMDVHAPDGDMFRYDDSTKTIRFPVVINDEITKRRITYKFTGLYFEKIK